MPALYLHSGGSLHKSMPFSCLGYFQCNKEAIFFLSSKFLYINMTTADPGSISLISGEVIIFVVHEQKYSSCCTVGYQGKLPHLTILIG